MCARNGRAIATRSGDRVVNCIGHGGGGRGFESRNRKIEKIAFASTKIEFEMVGRGFESWERRKFLFY